MTNSKLKTKNSKLPLSPPPHNLTCLWGTLLGALLIGTINNAMNLLLISSYWQLIVRGTIIVAAVLLDRLRED